MPTNRDDFTPKTKDLAARRVGFLCSKPDCRCHTIGPSRESNRAVSNVGVAAHICAAAPGGKRYDVNMTPEERMDIENCLWLCQTDAHLIDTDDVTYSVELLRKWKRDAEEYAASALSDGNFLRNYHTGNGDNLTQLEELFNSMVRSGEFDLMHKILSQYSTGLSEKYDECIVRNKIIWCVYCNREGLRAAIDTYVNLPDKSGANDLLRLFLSFGMLEEQKNLRNYCTEEDLGIVLDLAINNDLEERLIGKHESTEPIEVTQTTKEAIDKYLLWTLCKKGMFGLQNSDGSKYEYDPCEVYWTALWEAYSIATSMINGVFTFNGGEAQFRQLLKKVSIYDSNIQSIFWDMALSLLVGDKVAFDKLYAECPDKVRGDSRIKRTKLAYDIEHEHHSINIDDLLSHCSSSKDYYLAVQYCEKLAPEDECTFLEEHQYLYRKDSRFIYRRIIVHRESFDGNAQSLLEKYKNDYFDDFLIDCMEADLASNDQVRKDILEKIKKYNAGVTFFALNYYAKILSRASNWEDLIELSKRRIPQGMQHNIADNLAQSKQPECLARGIEMYQSLIASGYLEENLHHNLGVGYSLLGRIEDAKQELKTEYDIYKSEEVLGKYLALRFETNELVDDEYLQTAKQISTWHMQNLVGATYAKLGLYEEARKYFLRSLLLNEQGNLSVTGYWNMCRRTQNPDPQMVGADTAFTITDGESILNIALHRPQIIDSISPHDFAGYCHYSSQDPAVAAFMYCKVNDQVEYNGREYTITEIEHIDNPLCRYAFSLIMELPSSHIITGSSPEESLEKLIEIMKEQNESHQAIISQYNEMPIRTPLSVFAHQFGKNRLLTWEFLSYANEEPIRNNTIFPDSSDRIEFVLSYDGILALSRLNIPDKWPEGISLICSTQVKNQLLLDISEELRMLDEAESAGSMQYSDDGLRLIEHTAETRRARNLVLVKLKALLSKLIIAPPVDFISDDSNMREFTSEPGLRCETGTLALAKNTVGSILITDDQFLSCAASFFGIDNAGITFLISKLGLGAAKLIDASRKLKELNFQNYLPFGLYKSIFDKLDEGCKGSKDGELLGAWLLGDPEGLSDCHKEIVIALYRDVVQAGEDYLNPSNILGQLAIRYHESMHPGFVESLVRDALKDLRIEILKDDNPVDAISTG